MSATTFETEPENDYIAIGDTLVLRHERAEQRGHGGGDTIAWSSNKDTTEGGFVICASPAPPSAPPSAAAAAAPSPPVATHYLMHRACSSSMGGRRRAHACTTRCDQRRHLMGENYGNGERVQLSCGGDYQREREHV